VVDYRTRKKSNVMDAIRSYFTMQKIINYGPPPSLAFAPGAIKAFELAPHQVRLPVSVLGFGEEEAMIGITTEKMTPLLIMSFDDE
jgi:hypothetical protein